MIMVLTRKEVKYLTAIYKLWEQTKQRTSTNELAAALGTSPAAVTDSLKRLAQKKLVLYKKYAGVLLSVEGKSQALQLIRKQRLWEVWLVETMKLDWEEVGELSNQLASIQSPLLANRLAEVLNNPTLSPFGAPIPDAEGAWTHKPRNPLSSIPIGTRATIVAFQNQSADFLQYLNKKGIFIGASIVLMDKLAFDQSLDILVDNKDSANISEKVSQYILVVF